MKTLFTTAFLLYSLLANAQYLDSTRVIVNAKIAMHNLKTKKIILYLRPGDTISLLNTRNPNYYYVVDWRTNKRGSINTHSLDSSDNIQTALEYRHKENMLYYKYVKVYGVKWAADLVNKNPKIGMTQEMIRLIKGEPTKINTSHFSSGVHSQWVYRNDLFPSSTEYFYFQNGKLTSWQE